MKGGGGAEIQYWENPHLEIKNYIFDTMNYFLFRQTILLIGDRGRGSKKCQESTFG